MGLFDLFKPKHESKYTDPMTVSINLATNFDYVSFNLDKYFIDGEDAYLLRLVFVDKDQNAMVDMATAIAEYQISDIVKGIEHLYLAGFLDNKNVIYVGKVKGPNFEYEIDWRDYGLLANINLKDRYNYKE